MQNLLIVEDDRGLREQMKWALCEAFDVVEADSLPGALEAFREAGGSGAEPALVCLDMGLEGRPDRGLDVIDALLAADRGCKIVAVTASADEALGREAIRRGAFDYLRKPVDPGALRMLLERAQRIRELEGEVTWLPVPSAGAADGPAGGERRMDWGVLGESESMRKIQSVIHRLAPTDVSVLISGESGTGKDLCARALHDQSRRRGRPFVPVPCGSIPDPLLEAELFGGIKPGFSAESPAPGAMAGDPAEKTGLLEAANHGTLYLDDVSEVSPSLQARLMRFMQDQKVQRPGEPCARVLDVRIIGASSPAPAPGSVPAGPARRSDLANRLGEFEIALPPLRERGRDALVIASSMVERNRARFSQPRLRLSSRAEKLILSYGWPGNVRELENRLNRASIACQGQVIEEEDLQVGGGAAANLNYREQRRIFERNLLVNALKRTNGNVSLAARTMGVTRPTFYDMMRKSGVSLRLEPKI